MFPWDSVINQSGWDTLCVLFHLEWALFGEISTNFCLVTLCNLKFLHYWHLEARGGNASWACGGHFPNRWRVGSAKGGEMSPSGTQRHRNKKRVLAFSPRCELLPLLTTQTQHTVPWRWIRRWTNILLGAKEGPSRSPTPTPQLWLVEATGAVLKSHCDSPLYVEGGLTGILRPFKVIWTKVVAESDNNFQGHCSLPWWWEML